MTLSEPLTVEVNKCRYETPVRVDQKGVIHTGTWPVYCPHDLALIQLLNPERRHAWAEKNANPLPPSSTSGQNHRRRGLREPDAVKIKCIQVTSNEGWVTVADETTRNS